MGYGVCRRSLNEYAEGGLPVGDLKRGWSDQAPKLKSGRSTFARYLPSRKEKRGRPDKGVCTIPTAGGARVYFYWLGVSVGVGGCEDVNPACNKTNDKANLNGS